MCDTCMVLIHLCVCVLYIHMCVCVCVCVCVYTHMCVYYITYIYCRHVNDVCVNIYMYKPVTDKDRYIDSKKMKLK